MTGTDRSLLRLARLAGIAPAYRDAWGKQRRVTPETLRQILGAMGLVAATRGDVAAALAELEAERWRALLPPVATALDDESATVPVTVADAQEQRVSWTLMLESGEQREGAAMLDELPSLGAKRRIRRLALPVGHGLPLGHHRLAVSVGAHREETALIVAPRTCYLPRELQPGGRAWGLTAQLYGVRSLRNWGIGDLTDLAALAAGAARARWASIRSMRCSRPSRGTAAPIRRRAGCSSIRSTSTSRRCPISPRARRLRHAPPRPRPRRGLPPCATASWSTTPPSPR